MEQLLVQSLDELTTQIDTACQKGRRVYLYFSGSTDLTTGDSWSPECCQYEDARSTRNIIESIVKEAILQNYDRSKAITCLTDEASDG
ncbi:unnamed protein product [Trichobilharzia regenti]|nr:unnamed protein product [Trichobilharzia regenti]